jgi:hypothetical protein
MHANGIRHLLPIMSLAAAVYLIFVGLLGLNGIYHLFK